MVYQLKNDKYSLTIHSLGAELKSLKLHDEEYLYGGDEIYWHRSSPVLFPIVGKLKNNNYKVNGKKYTLGIHGFAREQEFELIEENDKKLIFNLCENEQTLKHYPFTFNLKIQYKLKEDCLKITYEVISKENIFFSLGAHPAFLLKSEIQNSYFEFDENEKLDLLCLDLENGCIGSKKENFLLGNKLPLAKGTFKDDALIFRNPKSNSVTFKNTENKKSVHVEYKSFEYISFWAPLDAPFVCIEPWCGVADSTNTNHNFEEKTSIISLKKDELFSKSLYISLK